MVAALHDQPAITAYLSERIVSSLSFSPREDLCSVHVQDTLYVFETKNGEQLSRLEFVEQPIVAGLSSEGVILAYSDRIELWSDHTDGRTHLKTISIPSPVRAASLSGSKLVLLTAAGDVLRYRGDSLQSLGSISGIEVASVSTNPSGNLAALLTTGGDLHLLINGVVKKIESGVRSYSFGMEDGGEEFIFCICERDLRLFSVSEDDSFNIGTLLDTTLLSTSAALGGSGLIVVGSRKTPGLVVLEMKSGRFVTSVFGIPWATGRLEVSPSGRFGLFVGTLPLASDHRVLYLIDLRDAMPQ